MSEETQEIEDIIEDVTEEQLIANEELEQDLPEVSEEAEAEVSFDDSIKSILLGEKKKYKKEEEDEDESEEEEEEEEEEDEEESDKVKKEDVDLDESAKPSTGKATIDIYVSDAKEDMKIMSKYNLKAKMGKRNDSVIATGKKTDIFKYLRSFDYGMDINDVQDTYPELFESNIKEEEEEPKESKKKVSEALDLLITNEATLSEDFKTEAATLFEAAIAERSLDIQEKLEAKYNSELNEEVESLRESLIERIDDYLSYVVESWIEENSEQVENTLRTEIAENFMTSLKDLFIENYIEVPAEKRDLVEELNTVNEETESELTEAKAEIESLQEQVESFERSEVLSSLSEDLSETESHRLQSIFEDVDFGDKESFAKKAQTVKSSIFESKEETSQEDSLVENTEDETEIVIEGAADPLKKLPASMRKYVEALSK